MPTTHTRHSPHLPPEQAVQAFVENFGGRPRLFSAPGRINIIGEHTDYSEGFVMPAAINRNCVAAIGQNTLGRLRVFSVNRQERADLGEQFVRRGDWTDYVNGVRAALADAGIRAQGCDLVVCSDVPEGAGVSSSAALEVSVASAMAAIAQATVSKVDIARCAQAAESTYVGMPCGIMDQFIAANGVAGHALALDCRTLEFKTAPAPHDAQFIVIDSAVRHKLVDGGYAARRADCEAAAQKLGVPFLRDATVAMLAAASLPDRLNQRARHVVTENRRVLLTAAALEAADLQAVGKLMDASHASLRDDFNVTCTQTDTLAAIASAMAGVYGARQMGGGFGGSVLVLADRSSASEAADTIVAAYEAASGLRASAFICALAAGVREITV